MGCTEVDSLLTPPFTPLSLSVWPSFSFVWWRNALKDFSKLMRESLTLNSTCLGCSHERSFLLFEVVIHSRSRRWILINTALLGRMDQMWSIKPPGWVCVHVGIRILWVSELVPMYIYSICVCVFICASVHNFFFLLIFFFKSVLSFAWWTVHSPGATLSCLKPPATRLCVILSVQRSRTHTHTLTCYYHVSVTAVRQCFFRSKLLCSPHTTVSVCSDTLVEGKPSLFLSAFTVVLNTQLRPHCQKGNSFAPAFFFFFCPLRQREGHSYQVQSCSVG